MDNSAATTAVSFTVLQVCQTCSHLGAFACSHLSAWNTLSPDFHMAYSLTSPRSPLLLPSIGLESNSVNLSTLFFKKFLAILGPLHFLWILESAHQFLPKEKKKKKSLLTFCLSLRWVYNQLENNGPSNNIVSQSSNMVYVFIYLGLILVLAIICSFIEQSLHIIC